MSSTSARKPGLRGQTGYLRGRSPNHVATLLTGAVRATGGPGESFRWGDLRDHFREQGMEPEEAEAFAGELAYGHYAEPVRGKRGVYTWAPEVYRLTRHRAWRFPRGQLDLAAAEDLIAMVEARKEKGQRVAAELLALVRRLKDATRALK